MNPAFRFARGGKVYKELEADEAHQIAGYLRTGIISPNDDYWSPGMADWKKVSSRQWDFPNQEAETVAAPKLSTSAPTATARPSVSQAQPQTSLPAGMASSSYSCECTACKKGFNQPAKSVSGYSVIGKAALFFFVGSVLLAFSWGIYMNWTMPAFFGESRINFVLSVIVYAVIALSSLGLLLMSLFELISASVTHGLYRANPERCPHCKSLTFTKRG